MKYEFSQHARDALAERGIPTEWVERALDNPERTERDSDDPKLTHRLTVIPEHGNRVLRVVVNEQANPPRVVTVYFDRKMKGRL
jgi:hypothetical protein